MHIYTEVVCKSITDNGDGAVEYDVDMTRASFETETGLGTTLEIDDEDYGEGIKIVPWNRLTKNLTVRFEPGDDYGSCNITCPYIRLGTDQNDVDMAITAAHEASHSFSIDITTALSAYEPSHYGLKEKSWDCYNLDESRSLYISALSHIIMALFRDYKKRVKGYDKNCGDWTSNVISAEDWDCNHKGIWPEETAA